MDPLAEPGVTQDASGHCGARVMGFCIECGLEKYALVSVRILIECKRIPLTTCFLTFHGAAIHHKNLHPLNGKRGGR